MPPPARSASRLAARSQSFQLPDRHAGPAHRPRAVRRHRDRQGRPGHAAHLAVSAVQGAPDARLGPPAPGGGRSPGLTNLDSRRAQPAHPGADRLGSGNGDVGVTMSRRRSPRPSANTGTVSVFSASGATGQIGGASVFATPDGGHDGGGGGTADGGGVTGGGATTSARVGSDADGAGHQQHSRGDAAPTCSRPPARPPRNPAGDRHRPPPRRGPRRAGGSELQPVLHLRRPTVRRPHRLPAPRHQRARRRRPRASAR